MNSIETGRLIRRIVSALKGECDPSIAPKLAEDFTAVCTTLNLRLEQCLSMIEAGASAQAVQLAETSPNLLDLVTLVEFRQADEWRQFCVSKGFSCPEKLNPKAVTALNDCYAKGISPQHPVYAAYREAALAKNDDAALAALKSIVRLNPADSNAVAELARLDAKLLKIRLAKLEQLLATNPEAALQELNYIETTGFKSDPAGDIWQRGQLLRSKNLLAEAEAMRQRGDLAEVVMRLDYLAQLRSDHKLEWPAGWNDQVEKLRSWCQTESAARQEDEAFDGAQTRLRQALLAARQRLARPKKSSIAALKKELDGLYRLAEELEGFSRAIPDELQQDFAGQSGQLKAGIRQQTRSKQMRLMAGSATVLLILLAMAAAFWSLRRADALTDDLRKAIKSHQTRALETLLKQAGSTTVMPTPRLKSACAAAVEEIRRQVPDGDAFKAAFNKLPTQLDAVTTLQQFDNVARDFASAKKLQQVLVGDLQAEALTSLDGFQTRWVDYCVGSLPAITQQLNAAIGDQESAVAKFNQEADTDRFSEDVSSAAVRVDQLSGLIKNLSDFVKIPADLSGRCNALVAQIQNAQDDLVKIQSTISSLVQARSLSGYGSAVATLGGFTGWQLSYLKAARQAGPVADLQNESEALDRALLSGTNLVLWQMLKEKRAGGLTPPKVTADARQRFVELTRDYAVKENHWLYEFYFEAQPSQPEKYITTEIIDWEPQWQSVQMWKVDPDGACDFQSQDYGVFDGHKKLSTNVISDIKMTDLSGVTSAWKTSGFDRLIDTRSLKFTAAPLSVADDLCSDTNASALFRTYLLKELVSIMSVQPDESGLAYVPELRLLPDKLRELGAGELSSGDWFVLSRVNSLEPVLGKYLESIDAHPASQASKLLLAMQQAQTAGFDFAGHINPDGMPEWMEKPVNGYVWGFQEGSTEPGLIYIFKDGHYDTINKPLLLTPLLYFKGDLPAILAQSGVRAGDPRFKGLLPPVFSVPVSP